MIDGNDIKYRCSHSPVLFRNLPDCNLQGAVYIENEYHQKMNRYLRKWGWWLQKRMFRKYEYGYKNLVYVPNLAKKIRKEELVTYRYPFLPKELSQQIADIKTTDLLDYLEDPDDARFLKPGFLFFMDEREDGISVYEYYPLAGLDNKALSYREQIAEILKAHKKFEDECCQQAESRGIGHSGLYCTAGAEDEDYADNEFESFDSQTQSKLLLFRKQVMELKNSGVPSELLEYIIHQNDKLSRLVITKKNEIILPDYNNISIKMEPLVKAIFFLFLKHPEGIIFKHLPDYRQELISIYKDLRPLGLNKRSLQSIEDVTNPMLNSINEKCARIRAAFIKEFDHHLAKYYVVTGERGEAKKITLPRDLVIWE
jgi:hypothetical protein